MNLLRNDDGKIPATISSTGWKDVARYGHQGGVAHTIVVKGKTIETPYMTSGVVLATDLVEDGVLTEDGELLLWLALVTD
jgi:adenylosuccinate synthase